MIEDVEELRTEREAVFLGDREPLAQVDVPVLLKRPADNIPAQVPEQAAAGGTNRERLIARSTIGVEPGNHRASRQSGRRSQDARVKYPRGAREILWPPAQHEAPNAANEVWIRAPRA